MKSWGIDVAEASIGQARARAQELGITNAMFRVEDVHAAELPEDSFDVAHFSGVLAYERDPLATLKVAYRALKPGGVIAVREPQKEGDWAGGPYGEAVMLFDRLVNEDAFNSGGGDPFIGRRLGTLLLDAGFELVEVMASYSHALSDVGAAAGWCLARLSDAAFSERVARRGWITAEQLSDLARSIAAWRDSPTSVIGVAECTAVARKP